ncbi:MAG: hypothetical protein H6Q60_1307 [Oscillospiraceae bacterium]|nr:hypothetical protein [Oscillospiraceae bacterium]
MRPAWNPRAKAIGALIVLTGLLAAFLMLADSLENESTAELLCGIGVLAAATVVWVQLLSQAGRRPSREGIVLNWQDRIPFDLYLAVIAFPYALLLCFAADSLNVISYFTHWEFTLYLLVIYAPAASITLALSFTLATRIKSKTLWSNTLLCRLYLHWGRIWREVILRLPLYWRSAVLFCGYVMVSAGLMSVMRVGFLLCLLLQVTALFFLLRWIAQWSVIRAGTATILSGDTDYHIDTQGMLPDLREHANQLNCLGLAINHAVEERYKSEHFKAELITNVSHDLKTPLTSIINYVDLLKKENIDDETVRGYLDVLERKSQRLKKLTEDLVEASKASTGNLSVERERLDLVQLITQATGEYEEKMTGQGLSLRLTLPTKPVYVVADGRHLWRILDNLLSNCVKYALENTRVYLEISVFQKQAALAVKNISREPLNIDPDALLERFVRGDTSRATEGSGLGLSIARSLTELQDGSFELSIDGDLFKATITLPMDAPEEPEHPLSD